MKCRLFLPGCLFCLSFWIVSCPAKAQLRSARPLAGPSLTVTPNVIHFGRVRVGTAVTDTFRILNNLATQVTTARILQSQVVDPYIHFDTLPGTSQDIIAPNSVQDAGVHYMPMKPGYDSATVFMIVGADDQASIFADGTGVAPRVISGNYDFGTFRDSSASQPASINITNLGNDSTRIVLVEALQTSDLRDFSFFPDTLPTRPGHDVTLDYKGPNRSAVFNVVYNPIKLGHDTLIVHIQTLEQDLYDTITGYSVEPRMAVTPASIDFGTIVVQKLPTIPVNPSATFTVKNVGTGTGYLDSVYNSDPVHFAVTLSTLPVPALNDSLPATSSLIGTVTFKVISDSDFTDTIVIANDTRWPIYGVQNAASQTRLIVHAQVIAGLIDYVSANFDTIRNCVPVSRTITLHNPYPVSVHIDSIKYVGDSIGFSYSGFGFPINIPSDQVFSFDLNYTFPADSLNAYLVKPIILYEKQGIGQPDLERFDTVTVVRQQRTLSLMAKPPAFLSSAGDIAPLRLPITITGPRDSLPELDDWTLTLHFSNDLFMPVDVETKNALATPRDPNYPILTHWDQATRTYTIKARNVSVSDQSKLGNNLLLTVLLRSFVTTDTAVTVTPVFTFERRPCAYNLQPFTLHLGYADECGEPVMRQYLRSGPAGVVITGIAAEHPQASSGVLNVSYKASQEVLARASVLNELGQSVGAVEAKLVRGQGMLRLPCGWLSSGMLHVRIDLFDPQTMEFLGFRSSSTVLAK